MFRLTVSSLVATAAVLSACARSEPAPPEGPFVRTMVVEAAPGSERRYTGVIRSRVESALGFRIGGKVTARLVNSGDRVRRGQALMRLDPVDFGLAVEGAGGRVAGAEAEASRAAREEERLNGLVEAGAVSQSAYDAALAARQSAEAALTSARAAASEAANQSKYAILTADADGVVTEILAEPGQVVAAGVPVLRLARAGSREAQISVPETAFASLARVGTASLYGQEQTFPVRLREIAGEADPATRTFEARYSLPEAGAQLPLGATVTVRLAGQAPPALRVPLSALHDPGTGPGVWVVVKGQARHRPVRVLALQEEDALVAADALRPGERIVTLGAHLLRQGQKVRPLAAGRA